MYCPQCGTHSLEYSKFCHGCGAALPTREVTALEARQSGVAFSSGKRNHHRALLPTGWPAGIGRMFDRGFATGRE